jgi:hypothetical protein
MKKQYEEEIARRYAAYPTAVSPRLLARVRLLSPSRGRDRLGATPSGGEHYLSGHGRNRG